MPGNKKQKKAASNNASAFSAGKSRHRRRCGDVRGNLKKMKNKTTILFILIILISCQSKPEIEGKNPKIESNEKIETKVRTINEEPVEQNIQEEKENKIEQNESKSKVGADIFIDNDSYYSKKFISEISTTNGVKIERIELKNGKMILNKNDTIFFPELPKLNQKVKFTGRKDNLAIALTINRINYTSIEYYIEIAEFGNSTINEMGIADIGGLFFLGSESDFDELSGESYFSTEFTNSNDSCYTNIRIRNVEDSPDKPLLAKFNKNCNGKIMTSNLNDFPTLKEK